MILPVSFIAMYRAIQRDMSCYSSSHTVSSIVIHRLSFNNNRWEDG